MRSGPYRFFFLSSEAGEPPHVHVQRERMLATFWLNTVGLARSTGFSPRELRGIQSVVAENEAALQEAWNDYSAD